MIEGALAHVDEDGMNAIEEAWAKRQCPIVNGIIYESGTVIPTAADATDPISLRPKRVKSGDVTSLTDLATLRPLDYTECNVLCEAVDQSRGLRALAGETFGFGGDGFVALLEGANESLQWIAFFDYANPFEEIAFAGDFLVVRNNLREVWSLFLAKPDVITISGGYA